MHRLMTGIAVGVVLALSPTAAMAYTPTPSGPTSVTVTPGQPATLTFDGFEPAENVVFTLTGENAEGATLAGAQSATKVAEPDGAASVTVTLAPASAGRYVLTAVGQSSGGRATVTVDSGIGSTQGGGVAGVAGDELAGTGPAFTAPLILGAAALLTAGAGGVLVASRRRSEG